MRLKLSSILSALILTGIHASSQVSADSNPWEQAIAQMNTAAGTDSLNFWQWAWYWQRSPAFSSAPGGFGVLGSIDNTSGLMDKIVAMGGGNGFQIVSAEQWVLYYRQAVWAWYWARYPAFSGAPPGGFGVLGSIDNTHAIIQPSITAVANAASFIPGLAPGGIVTIFGTNLSNISGIIAADKTPLPTDLGGTQVIVSGFADSDGTTSAAALFSVANINGQEQINLQIPWHVVGLGCYISAPDGCDVSIVVINNGISSDRVVINTSIAQPGIFTVDGSTGLITQADTNQLVTKDAPAASGEVVSIYSTGLGPIFGIDSTADGVPAPPDSPIVGPIPYVTIDGQSSEVLKSVLAPGFVGVNRVDVRIPAGVSSGSVDVIFSVKGFVCIPQYSGCDLWTSKAAKVWVQ